MDDWTESSGNVVVTSNLLGSDTTAFLLRELQVGQAVLLNEVRAMRSLLQQRHRRELLLFLHQPSQRPSMTFEEWVAQQALAMTDEVLDRVCTHSLTAGMLMLLEKGLVSGLSKLPLRAFEEKKEFMYVFSRIASGSGLEVAQTHVQNVTATSNTTIVVAVEPGSQQQQSQQVVQAKWRRLVLRDLQALESALSRQILVYYLNWQRTNSSMLAAHPERELMYMSRVNGGNVTSDRRCQEIKRWLEDRLPEPFPFSVDMEYG